MRPKLRVLAACGYLAAGLAVSSCGLPMGPLPGQATEAWTRSYPLQPGGRVELINTNGRIEVEGADGSQVEVTADRLARATTDSAAQDLLKRTSIKEDVTPGRIRIESQQLGGLLIGVSYEVRYHVRVPRGATVQARNTNGLIRLASLAGAVDAQTTNGGVDGRHLTGAVEARATNGGVRVDLDKVGSGRISLGTTNGGVALFLPKGAKADIDASCTNGGISVDVPLVSDEQSRRHVHGTLNGGGTAIELRTTNGGIRIQWTDGTSEAVESPLNKLDRLEGR